MVSKISLSIFVPTFLIISFLFLALPEKGNSSVLHGCCIVDSECVGCDDGTCAASESFCEEAGSAVQDGACVNQPGGDFCDFNTTWDDFDGCCVIDTNNCSQETSWRDCVGDEEPNLNGQVWLPETSCRQVPQCTVRNVPTISQWGLIATAGILGIIGLLWLFEEAK